MYTNYYYFQTYLTVEDFRGATILHSAVSRGRE